MASPKRLNAVHQDPVVQAIREMLSTYGLYHPCGRPNYGRPCVCQACSSGVTR